MNDSPGMSRDPFQLKVFAMADALALDVYRATIGFPAEERFGLQSQLRRAAVSVPTNVVEGAARRSGRDYIKFLDIALGSASEARYLTSVATRLGYLDESVGQALEKRFAGLIRALQSLITSLDRLLGSKQRVGTRSSASNSIDSTPTVAD